MNAYNPQTGQTIEISEYGFEMLQRKGWTRAADQTVPSREPELPPTGGPLVNMQEELEKRKAELAKKYKPVVEGKPANVDLVDIPAGAPFPSSTLTEAPTQAVLDGKVKVFPDSDKEKKSLAKQRIEAKVAKGQREIKPKVGPGKVASKKQTTKK